MTHTTIKIPISGYFSAKNENIASISLNLKWQKYLFFLDIPKKNPILDIPQKKILPGLEDPARYENVA
jgi:hypothetical protein